uniref:L-Fucosyltransferase n=1 Tax=Caenorhabditis japonica TaxID=281687 RepID=A0A8R1E5V0_CAEJA
MAISEKFPEEMHIINCSLPFQVAFIICSDDIAWARRNLKLGKEIAHYFCPGPREVDMAILASCDSIIISTGTFGWWSAYLNVNASPDVYYYKHWPAAGSVMEKMTNKTEYFLKNWVPLE